jgi:Toprim domain
MRNDLAEIKQALTDRIEEVCQKLLPGGRRDGGVWLSHNPMVADDARHLPALKVGLARDKGAWRCWRHGDKGDVIKLIEFTQNTDLKGALQWGRDFLGLRAMSLAEREAMRQAGEARAKRAVVENAAKRKFKLRKAEELFTLMAQALDGRSAAEFHGREYMRSRNCAFEDIRFLNRESFRFANATEWWKGAKWEYREGRRIKTQEGPRFPAIHAAMRSATGQVTCTHVTFLDPVLPQKAPVDPPKLMFGEALGAVIEISTGPSGLPFWHPDAPPGPLIVGEGSETACSVAGPIEDARVWAAGSLAGMGAVPAHLACVSDITLARDNNDGNAQAREQLAKCIAQLEAHGKPLVVMKSHVGDDFNDLMQGEET